MKIEERFYNYSRPPTLFTKLRTSNRDIIKSRLSRHLTLNRAWRGGFLIHQLVGSNQYITIDEYSEHFVGYQGSYVPSYTGFGVEYRLLTNTTDSETFFYDEGTTLTKLNIKTIDSLTT